MNGERLSRQEEISVSDDVQVWQQGLLRVLFIVLVVLGIPVLGASLHGAYESQRFGSLIIDVGIYALLVVVAFWQRVPHALRVTTLLGAFYGMGMWDLIEYGQSGDGSLLLLPCPLLAVIFIGRRQGILAWGFIILSQLAVGVAFSSGRIVIPAQEQAVSGDLSLWLLSTLVLGIVGTWLVVCPSYLMRRLVSALNQSRELVQELEQRVAAEQEQREHLQRAKQEIEQRMAGEQEQHEHLQRLLVQVRDAANAISSAAAEIMAATSQQSAGADEQLEAITQTIITVDEVKTIAEQSVARAQEVTDGSLRTVEVSHSGQQAVQETIASMAHIKTRVEGIAENILALSEQTQQIGEIIATVNDIAAQSNMLALNASVEAARAGEHGKGFAVVAVEVRNLAKQSRQATAQVKAILSDVQKATNATVMATEEGAKGVDEGGRLAGQAQDVIERLAEVIEGSAQAAVQMVAGGRQQTSGVEQIALAMQSISQATEQGMVSTRQVTQAARDLSGLAHDLAGIVKQHQG